MKNNSQQNILFTNSLFSTKEYNLSTTDQLKISEVTSMTAKSETLSLDSLEATPSTEDKLDPQWLAFTFICGLTSGVFYLMSLKTGLSITTTISALFFMASLGALFTASKKKVRSYTYNYANTTTPLFTLSGKQSDNINIAQFVENLNRLIKTSITKDQLDTANVEDTEYAPDTEEQEYLTYSYHLDYLYESDLVDELSYRKIGQNISDKIFGQEEDILNSQTNIINFPR